MPAKITPAAERKARAWRALCATLSRVPMTEAELHEVCAGIATFARACEDVARGATWREALENHQPPATEAGKP